MIVGLLLAAGAGSRFGGDKLLQPLPDGTPIGLAAARNLLQGVDQVVAVVRPGDEELALILCTAGLRVEICHDAAHGMGASLAHGVRSAGDADGWLIALADMPFIQSQTIRSVARLIESGASIAAPFHRAKRGHPVGFSRAFFKPLSRLHADYGAHDLLTAHATDIHSFHCNDSGILADIDSPLDLERVSLHLPLQGGGREGDG
jgi:molybdenum cofactor cytidylyltransferase